jgi:hypothetical protein
MVKLKMREFDRINHVVNLRAIKNCRLGTERFLDWIGIYRATKQRTERGLLQIQRRKLHLLVSHLVEAFDQGMMRVQFKGKEQRKQLIWGQFGILNNTFCFEYEDRHQDVTMQHENIEILLKAGEDIYTGVVDSRTIILNKVMRYEVSLYQIIQVSNQKIYRTAKEYTLTLSLLVEDQSLQNLCSNQTSAPMINFDYMENWNKDKSSIERCLDTQTVYTP